MTDGGERSLCNGAGGARARPPRVKIICRVDYEALRRGFATAGETCDIAGVGPVSVETLRALLPEAVVALVLTHSVAVRNGSGRRAFVPRDHPDHPRNSQAGSVPMTG